MNLLKPFLPFHSYLTILHLQRELFFEKLLTATSDSAVCFFESVCTSEFFQTQEPHRDPINTPEYVSGSLVLGGTLWNTRHILWSSLTFSRHSQGLFVKLSRSGCPDLLLLLLSFPFSSRISFDCRPLADVVVQSHIPRSVLLWNYTTLSRVLFGMGSLPVEIVRSFFFLVFLSLNLSHINFQLFLLSLYLPQKKLSPSASLHLPLCLPSSLSPPL